ncbi:StbB family protein [Ectopseudomonas hydrolytica]|uniref:StbB family protein n=1 Tax=Ectopseudomonas hydrolytica TaxID=2493633 RepID=UPI0020B6A4AA|nr:StbB family protein [Pseudomonas hydrolytica]UTH34334.1 plasmid stabilization protein [Pseudomonas hydrolytica]UZZ13657.1 plasmid stabilization protein [Pseudomonas mendocina]
MYVMVANFSGNSGKSTLADNLLAPRMNNAEVIRVETINAHEGDDADNLKGKQYGQIIEGLALFNDAIVDVGSSNVQDIMNLMAQYAGSWEVFDYFVIPTVAKPKQIRDTISTIEALANIGVPADKIRVVFNMIEDEDVNIEKEFAPLFAYHANEGKFTMNSGAVVYLNDFYSRVTGLGLTAEKILADETDYNQLLKDATTPDEKIAISQKRALKFLATGLKAKLDDAFKALFG